MGVLNPQPLCFSDVGAIRPWPVFFIPELQSATPRVSGCRVQGCGVRGLGFADQGAGFEGCRV